ncbi:MAG TPA: hypothetical protein VNV60_03230 [Holophagaceae bacterium]|nr:hypothetical protein [Holophagaceae bacterium]
MIENLIALLFGLWVLSYFASFCYMVKGRGLMSALFWGLIPMRFLLNMAVDGDYDDNPVWLDHIQMTLILALVGCWLLRKHLA